MARTGGDLGSWAVVSGLALTAVLQPFGCDRRNGDTAPVDETLAAVLADVWPEAVEPTLERARAEADALVEATSSWAEAERTGGDGEAAREAAQLAWEEAMAAWQEAEVMQIGPAGSSLTAVGGQDLRDEIYSWTTTNRCRVDQETVEAAWDAADFFASNHVNTYGLDALETLLYSPPGENACPPQVDINAEGTWEALGEDGIAQNRADYAVALAENVSERIGELQAIWSPDGEDFAGEVAGAGGDGSVYDSPEQALNAIFDALFYVELRTKDRKLGGPLGLWDCGSATCDDLVETQLAGGSQNWIAANLRGFRTLFTGGDGTGMDDLLSSLGEEDVAASVLSALDGADAAAAALEVPIDVAITEDVEGATALHAAIKEVTDLLKGDVATLLSLQIPSEASGDND